MNLLLISNTPMIIQIFKLISKKIKLELFVQGNNEVDSQYDFIVVDEEFIDDRFNIIKQYCKKLGAISSNELDLEKSNDFLIPRPFLPMQLQEMLVEKIDELKEEIKEEEIKEAQKNAPSPDVISFIESMADDIVEDIQNEVEGKVSAIDEIDENDLLDSIEEELENEEKCIIPIPEIQNEEGGVLDNKELDKISDILENDEIDTDDDFSLKSYEEFNHVENVDSTLDANSWQDLSDILDEALVDATADFDDEDLNSIEDEEEATEDQEEVDNNIFHTEMNLKNRTIQELKPVLRALDKESADALIAGKKINILLSLKDEDE